MKFLTIILLSLALILETTLTTIPLVLVGLICLVIVYQDYNLFLYGFFYGLFLDLILFNTIGLSSLYFVIFLFLVLLYQRKFEIKTVSFVLIACFLGSFVYLFLFSYNNLIIFQATTGAIIGLLIFKLLLKFKTQDLGIKS